MPQGLEALGGIAHAATLQLRTVHMDEDLVNKGAVARAEVRCPKATRSTFATAPAESRVMRLLAALWAMYLALRFEQRDEEGLEAPPLAALRAFGMDCVSCPKKACGSCSKARHTRIFPNQAGFWEDEDGQPHCACPVISKHPERCPSRFLPQCGCARPEAR